MEIPANASAEVALPFALAEQVKQDGFPVKSGYTQTNHDLKLSLGSGKYFFRYPALALKAAVSGSIK